MLIYCVMHLLKIITLKSDIKGIVAILRHGTISLTTPTITELHVSGVTIHTSSIFWHVLPGDFIITIAPPQLP